MDNVKMCTVITDLPPELIFRILENLSAIDIGQFSQTCVQLKELCQTDIVWQKICQNVCEIKAEEWKTSYYNLYTKVLHKYGKCLGLWRRELNPYGGLLQVKVDSQRLLGIEYRPPIISNIQGPLRPKNVFSINLNKSLSKAEILCLHGRGMPHQGSIQFDKERVCFKCCMMSSHVHPEGSTREFEVLIREETGNHSVPFTKDDQARLECYISHMNEYILTPIKIQPPDPVYPIQPGLFLAHYSVHGIEMFLLKYDMEKKEAEVVKITGDPNVPSGKTSIYVNLRKPIKLTVEEQMDYNHVMSISEEEVPDADEIQPMRQPFVILPNFQTFFGDFNTDTCQYRYFGRGRIADVGYRNPDLQKIHVVMFEKLDQFITMWDWYYDMDGFYRIKDIEQ